VSAAPLPLLLLFDIDGTLLIGGATGHGAAMHLALERVFGLSDARRHVVAYPGRTDLEIARELLMLSEVEVGPERLAELERAWVTAYEEIVEDDLSDRVAPGMVALLERLAGRDDVRLALLTGNLEPIARLKLARAGIGRFFLAGQGAFGSDSERRAQLPAVARRRAGGSLGAGGGRGAGGSAERGRGAGGGRGDPAERGRGGGSAGGRRGAGGGSAEHGRAGGERGAGARAGEARGGTAPWPRNRTLIIGDTPERGRGEPWPRARTLVIGDTPLDVACARADGVRVLGLAGGAFSMAELHEADAAAEDAEQLEALIEGEVGRVGR